MLAKKPRAVYRPQFDVREEAIADLLLVVPGGQPTSCPKLYRLRTLQRLASLACGIPEVEFGDELATRPILLCMWQKLAQPEGCPSVLEGHPGVANASVGDQRTTGVRRLPRATSGVADAQRR
jgi:hypothetical protein